MSLLCRLSGHRRRADLVKMGDDMRKHSLCERCGKPMVKTWDKGWALEKPKRSG